MCVQQHAAASAQCCAASHAQPRCTTVAACCFIALFVSFDCPCCTPAVATIIMPVCLRSVRVYSMCTICVPCQQSVRTPAALLHPPRGWPHPCCCLWLEWPCTLPTVTTGCRALLAAEPCGRCVRVVRIVRVVLCIGEHARHASCAVAGWLRDRECGLYCNTHKSRSTRCFHKSARPMGTLQHRRQDSLRAPFMEANRRQVRAGEGAQVQLRRVKCSRPPTTLLYQARKNNVTLLALCCCSARLPLCSAA